MSATPAAVDSASYADNWHAAREAKEQQRRLLVIARDGQQAGVAGTGTVLFTDATSGLTTDPQGRSLPVAFPAGAGPLTLDFNYTQNLQRPYTAFAPCPLPPAQNTVTVAIEAGERLPVFNR